MFELIDFGVELDVKYRIGLVIFDVYDILIRFEV